MIEINQNEVLNHRPFDIVQARQGAPVTIRRPQNSSNTVRIICMNRKASKPIVALVMAGHGENPEALLEYYEDGLVQKNQPTHWADLVMAPVGNIDGTPVFWGDCVYHRKTGAMSQISRNWPGAGGEQTLRDYAMQPPTIEFKGRPLTIRDEIWYKGPTSEYWEKVKACDHWTTKYSPGIDTTHFGNIRASRDSAALLECYSWDFPLEVSVRGKKLVVGERIWLRNAPDEAGLEITNRLIELIHKGTVKVSMMTHKPWVKKQNWQAEAQVELEDGVVSNTLLLGPLFTSEGDCKEKAPSMLPEGYKFLAAKAVSSYYM